MYRGLWTHAEVLYAVNSNKLFSIDSTGFSTELGTLNSGAGVVDFASNLTQLVFTDGSYLYVYDPVGKTFSTAANYPGGDRISFLNQRINFIERGTQKFGWTALGDALSINELEFASAESSPDRLVSQIVSNNELLLFGEEATEIWDATGDERVYAKSSAAVDYGCVAAHSVQKSANTVFWLAREKRGQAIVLSLRGHQASRISTRAEEEKFEGIELVGATAYTYSSGGQSFYLLNVPALDTTLVYDETYGQWHERAEWNGTYSKWRPTCHAFAYGWHYFGADDNLYKLDSKVHKFGDDVKRRQRIAPVISSPSMGRMRFSGVELLCEKNTGATVMLRYSDDNGAFWSDWHYTTVGEIGNFARRARFHRLGSAYDRVFDIVMTDDAPFNPVAVNIPL